MRIEDIKDNASITTHIDFKTEAERMTILRSVTYQGAPVFSEKILGELLNHNFFTAPASRRFHGSYGGGLFDHSFNVAVQLTLLTQRLDLKWKSPVSPFIVGIFHDLCKVDQYVYDLDTNSYSWNEDTLIKGHGIKSLVYAQRLCQLTEEEEACILYHMGAFTDAKEWGDYSNAIMKYPNVLFTHTADMIADKILGV